MKTKQVVHATLITLLVVHSSLQPIAAQNSFPTPTGVCLLDATGAAAGNGGQLRLAELDANGSNYIGLKAPDNITGGNQVYVFPNGFPTGSKVLSSDNSGNLSWVKRLKTDMSNLDATTSVNSDLLPNANNALDLGSNTFAWRSGHFQGSIGIGVTQALVKLHVAGGTDTELEGGGYLMLGTSTSENISFDNNEIEARNNDLASTLFLQNDGGNLDVGNGGFIVSGSTHDVSIGGILQVFGTTIAFGTIENFVDGGANLIVTNSDIAPDTDGSNSVGTSGNTWFDVWATDGTINTSDARLKENISDIQYGIADIMKMHPVSYSWIHHKDAGIKLGLLAQEMQLVLPEAVRDWEYSTDEQTGKQVKTPSLKLGIQYEMIIPVLIKGMQEQQEAIASQNETIGKLANRITELEQVVSSFSSTGGSSRFTLQDDTPALLGQNIPNPFDNTTVIPFRVPKNCNDASLRITETNTGRILRVIPLSCDETQISVDAGQLASGNYTYSLYVDGILIDTKQMLVTK